MDENETGGTSTVVLLSGLTSKAWSAIFSEYVLGSGALLRPNSPRFLGAGVAFSAVVDAAAEGPSSEPLPEPLRSPMPIEPDAAWVSSDVLALVFSADMVVLAGVLMDKGEMFDDDE